MNEMKNEIALETVTTLDSREVAEMVGKNHANLLRDIKTYIEYLGEINFDLADFFIESKYVDGQEKERPKYDIPKKGCEFIAHKLTGQKGAVFTAKYIDRFHKMEAHLKAPMQELSPQLQLLISMELKQKEFENAINATQTAITETKTEIQAMREVITISPNAWRTEVTNLLNKIAKERGGTSEAYREIRNESYKLLNERAGAKLEIRVTNRKRKVLEETGSKSKADKVSKLDVIGDDKRLTEVYIAIVKEMAIKYKVA